MRRLAWCSLLAGLATLFHCGGASDAPIGAVDAGGDGTSGEAGPGKEGGGGTDGSSSGGDSSSSSGAGEAGNGKETGAGEAGTAEGGPLEAGTESGAGEAGGGEAGSEGGVTDGGGDTGTGDAAATEAGGEGGAEAGSDAGEGGTVGKAGFRVAALMPAPAAIDFCWQSAGGAFNGPVMAGWGISGRLAYEQVTEYVPVPVGATTVRLVAASATDCTTSLGEVTFTPSAAGAGYLVASFTQGNVGAQVKSFADETASAGVTGTRLRAIDAAITGLSGGGPVGQPVDVYLPGSTANVLFDDVAFGATAVAGGTVDAKGYIPHDALPAVDLRVRLHAGADLLDVPALSTTGGHVYSLFTTGVHNLALPNPAPMKLVVCDDTAPAVGHLGVCSALGTQL